MKKMPECCCSCNMDYGCTVIRKCYDVFGAEDKHSRPEYCPLIDPFNLKFDEKTGNVFDGAKEQ